MTTISLVKTGQVGESLLTNLEENTNGAKALLEKAKAKSECMAGPSMSITGEPPIKTMLETFLEEAEKQEIIDAFEPLRSDPEASDMPFRTHFTLYDLPPGSQSLATIGKFNIGTGTTLPDEGMTNVKPIKFSPMFGDETNIGAVTYKRETGEITVAIDGIVHISGQFNLIMLPKTMEMLDTWDTDASPLPYLEPTFLAPAGQQYHCPYRLCYQHFTGEQSRDSLPEIIDSKTLFEGSFTHYDVAKNAEHRHGFTQQIRCLAGDKILLMFERGRDIAEGYVVKTSKYLTEVGDLGRANESLANKIEVVFLVD